MKALVLSGGAGFGAYQVGAWQALQEAGWEPDIVVGASIGAVNAYVIGHDTSIAELRQTWLDLPRTIHADRGRGRRIPVWEEADLFRIWVREVARRYGNRPLVRDLQITLTHLPTCAIRVARGSQITERHLLGSCALLGVSAPTSVDSGFYMDGGTFCRLPLRQALIAGATEIAAIDVLAVPSSATVRRLVRSAAWTRNFLRRERPEPTEEELAEIRLLRVGHPRPLGTIRDCFQWDSRRWERFIETGYRDTKSRISSTSWLANQTCERK